MRVLTRLNRSIERLDGMSRSMRRGKEHKAAHPSRRCDDERSSIERAMAGENNSSKEASICAK